MKREKSTLSFNTGHGCSRIEEVYYLSYSSSIRGNYKDLYLGYVITRGGPDGGYIYLSSHEIGDQSLNARIDDIYDSLAIADQTYYNVVKMYINIDKYIKKEMNLYFADSTGIIRKEIRNGINVIETYDLIESSVLLK